MSLSWSAAGFSMPVVMMTRAIPIPKASSHRPKRIWRSFRAMQAASTMSLPSSQAFNSISALSSHRYLRTFKMRLKRSHFLPAAFLILQGCAHLQAPSQRRIPPLDSSLARPCPVIPEFQGGDYDMFQAWVQDPVLRLYGECAARHKATVAAWPK